MEFMIALVLLLGASYLGIIPVFFEYQDENNLKRKQLKLFSMCVIVALMIGGGYQKYDELNSKKQEYLAIKEAFFSEFNRNFKTINFGHYRNDVSLGNTALIDYLVKGGLKGSQRDLLNQINGKMSLINGLKDRDDLSAKGKEDTFIQNAIYLEYDMVKFVLESNETRNEALCGNFIYAIAKATYEKKIMEELAPKGLSLNECLEIAWKKFPKLHQSLFRKHALEKYANYL